MPNYPKFDDDAYASGGKLFRKGRSLRTVIEEIVVSAEQSEKNRSANVDDYRKDESREFSKLIGFVDAVLNSLRGKTPIAAPDAETERFREQVLGYLKRLTREGEREMSVLDDLKTEVEQNKTVAASAVALIQGLAQKIQDAGTDPSQLQAIVDELKDNDQSLADAVAANTQPAPTAPASGQ